MKYRLRTFNLISCLYAFGRSEEIDDLAPKRTGGIITAAALIMITVFFGFVLDPNRAVKMLGIGLASAVFLDAFVLRTILVPSLMHMFGKANWFFPKALERVTPHISVDAEDAAAFDEAMAEEGDNIPWNQVKKDLGWE